MSASADRVGSPSSTTAPGNLVSIEQALTPVGAEVARRARARRTCDGVDALVVPGRRAAGAGDGPPRAAAASSTRSAPGSPPTGRSSGSASASSSCSRAATRTAPRRSASCPAGPSASSDAPTLPHIGWNQVERRREHPLFDGIADGADFYFVHSYAGAPAGGLGDARRSPRPSTARRSSRRSPAAPLLGVQFHPERSGADGLRLLANFVGRPWPRSAGPA